MKKFINANVYKHGEDYEILVKDGKIKEIGQNLSNADETIDLNGNLVLPPYVDPHVHLDYVFTGNREDIKNESGMLHEAISLWGQIKEKNTVEDWKSIIRTAIEQEVKYGTQYIRSHIDVTDPDLTALQAALEVKEELKDKVTIQYVAFPQEGMYSFRNGVELVEEGIKMGADVVGGIPHSEWAREYGEKSIHDSMEIALKYDKMIDLHIDENDDPMSRFVELFNALVLSEDYGSRSVASHTCSFGSADEAYASRMMGLFKKSELNFVSPVAENLHMMGRTHGYPMRRGATRIHEFVKNDINVAFAQDSIVDLWYPFGNGNLMDILDIGIHVGHLMTDMSDFDKNLDLITYNGAKAMNIQDEYGLESGKDANFIVLEAPNPYEAQRNRSRVLASIRNGEYLFKLQEKTYDVEMELF